MSPDAQHLDLDTLADLLAGEGPEVAVSHVADCSLCAEELDQLDAAQAPVVAALRALPAPVVPAALAARLRSAFAAAEPPTAAAAVIVPPGRDGSGQDSTDDEDDVVPASRPAAATVTPLDRQRRRQAWLPSAAAAVLVLCAGGLAVSLLGRGGSDSESSTAAPSSAAGGSSGSSEAADALAGVAFNASGRDYGTDPGALAQSLPGVLAGSAEGLAAPAPPAPAAAPSVSPDAGTPDAAVSEQRVTTPGLERLREPAGLASCLSALLPPGDPAVRPLALDYAAYAGQPALVVVLPATDPAKVDVFVVGAGCEATNDATLFFTRLDRPS